MDQSAIIGTTFVATLSGLWYIGVFDRIEFQEDTVLGPFQFFYKKHAGPYSQSGQHFEEIRKFLQSKGLKHLKTAGIYYDDPKTTKAPTRYAAGFLVQMGGGGGVR
jgi:DNA gyrase inhibitor